MPTPDLDGDRCTLAEVRLGMRNIPSLLVGRVVALFEEDANGETGLTVDGLNELSAGSEFVMIGEVRASLARSNREPLSIGHSEPVGLDGRLLSSSSCTEDANQVDVARIPVEASLVVRFRATDADVGGVM